MPTRPALTSDEFEKLFREYYPALVTYLVREFRLAGAAEDLIQGVFTQIWSRREQFNPEHGINPYLYGAARHAALNHLRDSRRYDWNDSTIEEDFDSILPSEPSPAALFEQRELEKAVQSAVDALPARAREIWSLHRDHGLTYPEIAAMLGISINTVKTQIGRSLTVLRRVAGPFLAALVTLSEGMRSL